MSDAKEVGISALCRTVQDSGHWRLPLSGHGLAYFDQLVVAYRTLPANGVAEDPWGRAVAAVIKKVREAQEAATVAVAEVAKAEASAQAMPQDPGLRADVTTKLNLKAAADKELEAVECEGARFTGVAEGRNAAGQIIAELMQRRERMDAVASPQPRLGDPPARPERPLLWSDVLVFESALLRMLWFDALKNRVMTLREEYREALGVSAMETMRPSLIELGTATVEKDFVRLQAEAVNLLSELQWHYVAAPPLERHRTALTLALLSYSAVVCGIILLLGIWLGSTSAILLAGAIGATLSAFQRIQNGGRFGVGLLNLRNTRWGSLSVGVAPVLGAISSGLLALAFAGGLMAGGFFPRLSFQPSMVENTEPAGIRVAARLSKDGGGPTQLTRHAGARVLDEPVSRTGDSTVTNATRQNKEVGEAGEEGREGREKNPNDRGRTNRFDAAEIGWPLGTHHWSVNSGADLALLLLWSFVAGFSERLVPDMLSRLSRKAQEKL